MFLGQPKYFTVTKSAERSQTSTSTGRHQKEADRIRQLEKRMRENDEVSDLSDLEKSTTIPDGFDEIRQSSQLIFMQMKIFLVSWQPW